MLLGKIKGSITSTIKHASLKAQKILIVEPLNSCWPLDSSLRWNDKGVCRNDRVGKAILALDAVQAGVGDTVLINQEGGSCRQVLKDDHAPVNHVVVGIVDSVS